MSDSDGPRTFRPRKDYYYSEGTLWLLTSMFNVPLIKVPRSPPGGECDGGVQPIVQISIVPALVRTKIQSLTQKNRQPKRWAMTKMTNCMDKHCSTGRGLSQAFGIGHVDMRRGNP